MASYGLLKGLGGGLRDVGEDISKRLREERLHEYQAKLQQLQFDRQDQIRAEDRANVLADRAVDTRLETDDQGNTFEVAYNADGQQVSRKQREPKEEKRFLQGNAFYDTQTGQWITSPAGAGGKLNIQKIEDGAGGTSLVQVHIGPDGNAYYTPIQPHGLLQGPGSGISPDEAKAFQEAASERAKSMGGGVMGIGANYGVFKDRATAEQYFYDQAIAQRNMQPFPSPAEWMRDRSGQAGQEARGTNSDPAAALQALQGGPSPTGAEARPRSTERELIESRRREAQQERQAREQSRKMESDRRGFDNLINNAAADLGQPRPMRSAKWWEEQLLTIIESPVATQEQKQRARQLLGL